MAGQIFLYFFAKSCQLQFDIFLRKINDLPKPGLRLDVHFTKQEEKDVQDLLESIVRPTDPVKEGLRQNLFKMSQFRPEITKIRPEITKIRV